VKTAISIPDAIFRQAERLAKAQRISRSELYVKAISQLLGQQPKLALTEAYDDAFDDVGSADETAAQALHDASRQTLLAVEWDAS
jgi:predicted transcriptional regulator